MSKWKNHGLRALAAATVGLVIAAATEQLTTELGGLEPFWLHGLVVGAFGALAAWLLPFIRWRWVAIAASVVVGSAAWVASSAVTMALKNRIPMDNLFLASGTMGALAGMVCAPVVDGIWLLRTRPAADGGSEVCARAGILAAIGGALLFDVGWLRSPMPSATLIAGQLLIAAALLGDRRRLRWLDRVRHGEVPGLAIRAADENELELPPLWGGDQLAEQVLLEQLPLDAGAYRSTMVGRPTARVSAFQLPANVIRRRYFGFVAATLTLIIVSFVFALG